MGIESLKDWKISMLSFLNIFIKFCNVERFFCKIPNQFKAWNPSIFRQLKPRSPPSALYVIFETIHRNFFTEKNFFLASRNIMTWNKEQKPLFLCSSISRWRTQKVTQKREKEIRVLWSVLLFFAVVEGENEKLLSQWVETEEQHLGDKNSIMLLIPSSIIFIFWVKKNERCCVGEENEEMQKRIAAEW